MRTDEEILAKIKELKESERDFFGFIATNLLIRLPFEKARPFSEYEGDKWTSAPRDRESILEEMRDYMPFAWDKANNCRGLSAARSLDHYQAWTWLAGDDLGDFSEYEYYGKDHLARICDYYGWDYSKWDDGVRKNNSSE